MSDDDEGSRILVVDDESSIRYSFSKTLERVGHIVDTAANSDEAIELMNANVYDVVFSDIRE